MLRHIGRDHPLVMVFAGLCCGIIISQHDISGIASCFVLIALLYSRERIPHIMIGLLLGLMVYVLAPKWVDVADGRHELAGVVESSEYAYGTFRMILGEVTLDGRHIRGRVLISAYDQQGNLRNGSRILCAVKIKKPRGYGNAEEFDYQLYLLSRNIVMSGVIEKPSKIKILKRSDSDGTKCNMIHFLNMYARPEAELIKAMVLGDRSGIAYSLQDRFNSLGISHLIAISGLHIAITMMIGYWSIFCIFKLIPPLALRVDAPFISRLGSVGAALAYSAFVGPEVTVVRSCIMAISCTLGLFFLRRSSLIEGLAIAGILILLFWPMALYNASFQLSFCAVLGIGGVLGKMENSQKLFKVLLVTPAAGVFTMPLAVYLFGFISSLGILANFIVVPFFSIVIMPLSILGMLLQLLHPPLCGPIFSIDMEALHLLLSACDLLGNVHPVSTPWVAWVYTSYIGLIVAFWGSINRWRTHVLTAICIVLFVLPLMKNTMAKVDFMKFDFISVGQGDCSLISQANHAVLVDAGPSYEMFDAGRRIVGPHLLRRGYTSLDVVIITHLHPDHCGGIPFILERFPVGQVWVNVGNEQNFYFQEVMRITKKKSIPLKYVCRGDSFKVGTMIVDVLNPQEKLNTQKQGIDQNLQSVVFMVQDGRMKGLFMGDADMFGELILVHRQEDISADVIKVAHHGGERSCLAPFLDSVRPGLAVISCGYGNRYGDPADSALGRLRRSKVEIYRTDMHGEVLITSW